MEPDGDTGLASLGVHHAANIDSGKRDLNPHFSEKGPKTQNRVRPSPQYTAAPMVLSDRTIKAEIEAGRIEFDPYDPDMVQPSSVDVRVDRRFRVFHNARHPFIDVRAPMDDLTELVEPPEGEPFILHPGEFVLGQTLERVRLPDDLVARLEGKSSLGRLGLIVHATAGFVDPGFSGTLTLEITNLTRVPIILWPGKPIAQLSFMALDQAAERPYGHPDLGSHYHGQLEATESRYEGGPAEASPTKPETA
jgi:dCTP deaminase